MSDHAKQSTGNAPAFDPLNCSAAEEGDMIAGYLDGWAQRPPTRESMAYAWGRGSALRDRGEPPDDERRAVEIRLVGRMHRDR